MTLLSRNGPGSWRHSHSPPPKRSGSVGSPSWANACWA